MASQWNSAPRTPNVFSHSLSPISFQGCRVLIPKRIASISGNDQAVVSTDEGGKLFTASALASNFMRSTAVFMIASFALGVRAASACSAAASSSFPNEILVHETPPLIRDETSFSCISAEMDAFTTFTNSSRTLTRKGNNLRITARRFMQGQSINEDVRDAEEPQRRLRDNSVEKMADAIELPESQTTSGVDKNFGKTSQELGSTTFKVTIPLRIVSLRGSLPPIWLKDFLSSQGKRVRLSIQYQNSLNEILSALHTAVEKKDLKPTPILNTDLVTIGDSWLQLAISGGLIQPIKNAENQEWFSKLGPSWQAFARRDQNGALNRNGLIWGVPYRWGSMVIAYKEDQLSKNNIPAIQDWKDLWRSELKGQIAMVDSPREVVGAVLKSLGASYNAQDFDRDVEGGKAAVRQQFLALQKQVKVFDNVHYLKAFGSDDVWVAVGWSSDVFPVAKRMSNVRLVIPKSGASLWADFWAIPAADSVPTSKKMGLQAHEASPLIHQWLDFCLQPARSLPFKQGIFIGVSPLFFLKDETQTAGNQGSMLDTQGNAMDAKFAAFTDIAPSPAMNTNMIEGMLPKDCLEKSEMLEPLSEKAVAEYKWLFLQAKEQDSHRKQLVGKFHCFFNVAARSSMKEQ